MSKHFDLIGGKLIAGDSSKFRAQNSKKNNFNKGCHTGTEFEAADNLDVDVLVTIPTVAVNAPNPEYNVEHFTYDKESDCYICPQGKELTTTGKWHLAKTYRLKRYITN